jgi:FMN-dependent oxidoreductase (nitrilotriacetate monooxygenase family)
MRAGKQRKQIHLAAHFPGVNNTTVWSDPDSGSQLDFSSFVHLAETAERGLFDFFFLAEGLRLREHRGRIHDLDVVGRPDTFTVLAALAAVTDRLGLVGTVNTTFNEPFEVSRQFATLDQLSDGRAGWNMVTSSDAFTGANFRRGGYLQYSERYLRAEEFITVARQFWDSWDTGAVRADDVSGEYVDVERVRVVEFRGAQFDVRGLATLPAGPQGHPILLQAGDSSDGRDFGAKHADALFTLHSELAAGQKYYADVKARAVANGRDPNRVKVFPAATFVLGDTPAEAVDRARHIRRQQVTGPTAIAMTEQVWQRDLSGYDPDGRPEGHRRRLARTGRGRGAEHPRTGHRGDQPSAVRRDPRAGGRRDRPARAVRCVRRVHPGAAPDPARAGRVRGQGRPTAAGAGHLP